MGIYRLRFALGVCVAVFGLGLTGHANFNGSDNFNGTTVNAGNWGTDFTPTPSSVGVFSQNNGLIYSTSGTPTSQDSVVHPWIANFGSYTADWTLQLGVSIPQIALSSGQEISLGIVVLNASDNSDVMTINFQQDPNSPQSIFVSGIDTGSNSTTFEQRTASEITSAALQMSWDAASQTLTASYNAGSGWITLASENITNSGTNDWGMNASSLFQAGIIGFATNKSVSTTDGVVATSFLAIPEPGMESYATLSGVFAVGMWFFRKRKKI